MPTTSLTPYGIVNNSGFFTTNEVNMAPLYYQFKPYIGQRGSPSVPCSAQLTMYLRYKIPFDQNEIEITRATLKLQKKLPSSQNGFPGITKIDTTVKAHLNVNSPGPFSAAEGVTQSTTQSTVNKIQVDVDVYTPQYGYDYFFDVKDILNEVMNQVGWVKDNYIVFFIQTNHVWTVGPYQHYTQYYHSFQDDEKTLFLEIDYENATGNGSGFNKRVIHDLVIYQQINRLRAFERTVESILDIVDIIAMSYSYVRDVTQDINIVSSGRVLLGEQIDVEDFIYIDQDISGLRPITKSVTSTVVFVQICHGGNKKIQMVTTILDVNQTLVATYSYVKDVESDVKIVEKIDKTPKIRSATNIFTLLDAISFQGVLQDPEQQAQTLTLSQTVQRNVTRTRSVQHDLSITTKALGYKTILQSGNDCKRLDLIYNPFGSLATQPILSQTTMTLTDGVHTLSLPRPLFGNREELQITRIQRSTRGGNLKIFRDAQWPTIRTFRYKFEGLSDTQINDVFTFFGQTLGKEITLTDYEGRVWTGFIVNPQGEAAQFFRVCGMTTEFDFEGVPV